MSTLKRYMAAIVFGVLALLLALGGLLAQTVWKPAHEVIATGTTTEPFFATRPGLFGLYGSGETVQIELTAEGTKQPVWAALGSGDDIYAWLETHSYDELYGLSDIETLKSENHRFSRITAQSGEERDDEAEQSAAPKAEPEEAAQSEAEEGSQSGAELVNPISSDMWWVEEHGAGSLKIVIPPEQMDGALLAATDGEDPAPRITFTWSTPQTNYAAIFLYSFAAISLVLALVTAFVAWRAGIKRRRLRQQVRIREEADAVSTEALEVLEVPETEPAPAGAEPASTLEAGDSPEVQPAAEEVPPSEMPSAEPEVQEDELTLSDEEAGAATEEAAPVEPADEPEIGDEPEITDEPEPATEPAVARIEERAEEIDTDSGLINLAALQGGGKFPTRRALREAQERGVTALVVEGREFKVPAASAPAENESPEVEVPGESEKAGLLGKRSSSSGRWRDAFGRGSKQKDQPGEGGDSNG